MGDVNGIGHKCIKLAYVRRQESIVVKKAVGRENMFEIIALPFNNCVFLDEPVKFSCNSLTIFLIVKQNGSKRTEFGKMFLLRVFD